METREHMGRNTLSESINDGLLLAWAAGYIDGEGYLGSQRSFEIAVDSVVPFPIYRLIQVFGVGQLIYYSRDHLRDKSNPNAVRNRNVFRWRATGEDAVVVAEKLLATGLLTNKKAQAYAIAHSRKYPSGSMTRETLWKAATQERKAEYNEDGTYRR
jgi:hypothetical protein